MEKYDLRKYYLQRYIYSGDPEVLKEAEGRIATEEWDEWRIGVLIESEQGFFDTEEEKLPDQIYSEIRRDFFYLNLNPRQSLLLFKDQKADYRLLANHLYLALRRIYTTRLHLAVSREFSRKEELPELLRELEKQMEEKYYHMDTHVFYSDVNEVVGTELRDSQIIQWIAQDIGRKDLQKLSYHYNLLVDKYKENSRFSAMYVRFVFSNVLQVLFEEKPFAKGRSLAGEVERLYRAVTIEELLNVTDENIKEYEAFLLRYEEESQDKVTEIRRRIEEHCEQTYSTQKLADQVGLEPGYLNYFFRKRYGMSLKRFLRICRMEKAGQLLTGTDEPEAVISARTGFRNQGYFERSFLEYYGKTVEEYREEGRKKPE